MWMVSVYPFDTNPAACQYFFPSKEEADRFIGMIPEEDHEFLSMGQTLCAMECDITTPEKAAENLNHYYAIQDEE